MAPLGDVAQALDACRAASGGAGLEVVGQLAADALHRVVPAEIALWADVVAVGGGAVTVVGRPGPVDDEVLARYGEHVAGHPGVGTGGGEPSVHPWDDAGDGHQLCLGLPATAGHRAGLAVGRPTPFTRAEQARLATVLPLLACALLAAGRTTPAGCGTLTARESAVLRSVATGMSDKQAARVLGVSPRTVGKHLEHIYAKLGVAGRTEAAAQVWMGR